MAVCKNLRYNFRQNGKFLLFFEGESSRKVQEKFEKVRLGFWSNFHLNFLLFFIEI